MNLLNQLRIARQRLRENTEKLLYERNKVPAHLRHVTDGYEIRETKRVDRDGNTTVKFELWQRIDVERVTLSTDIKLEVVTDKAETPEEKTWYE